MQSSVAGLGGRLKARFSKMELEFPAPLIGDLQQLAGVCEDIPRYLRSLASDDGSDRDSTALTLATLLASLRLARSCAKDVRAPLKDLMRQLSRMRRRRDPKVRRGTARKKERR